MMMILSLETQFIVNRSMHLKISHFMILRTLMMFLSLLTWL